MNYTNATKLIQQTESKATEKNHAEALNLIAQAKALINELPITKEQTNDPKFAEIFTKSRKKYTDKTSAHKLKSSKIGITKLSLIMRKQSS